MIPKVFFFITAAPIHRQQTLVFNKNRTSIRRTPRAALPPLSLTPTQQTVLAGVTIPTIPVIAYSEYSLLTTGCGLPPGPSGVIGGTEGISYLIVAAVISLSIYAKVTTGKGLPAGPAKLLGAVEGASFLLFVVGIAIAGYTAFEYGGLPDAMPEPGSRCYPID